MKPGVKTTEFWVTILNTALMMLVAFGIIQQEAADQWNSLLVPLIGAVLPIVVYVWGRAYIKARNGG